MRRTLIALTALPMLLGAPTGAQELPQILTSPNVSYLGSLPEATLASSVVFDPDKPVMYVSTWKGLEVWNITDPKLPVPMGVEPLLGHQNEAMTFGKRANGDRFVLFASNSAAADTSGFTNTTNQVVTVVEVTNPADPAIVGHVTTPSRTHTASCIDIECNFAYTDGRTQGFMSVIDLRNFRDPKRASVDRISTPVSQGHDEDYDEAGVVWHVGGQGSVALDVTDPERPTILNSTTIDAVSSRPWNRFIHHNSQRPFAQNFRHLTEIDPETGEERLVLDANGLPQSGDPALASGNVLLVTEELNLDTGCAQGDGEGAFQTWHVPFLHGDYYDQINAGRSVTARRGTIRPLDKWNTELGTGTQVKRVPGFCSSHYFDFHTSGIAAVSFYEQGVRLLDVRNPLDIKQVGWFMVPGMETWAAYWVPKYGADGKQTGQQSNIVYAADNNQGVHMLEVNLASLPAPNETEELPAPILPEWLAGTDARPSRDFGYACRIVGAKIS